MASTSPPDPGRRYDIDWLRIGATYLLFAFHVAKMFDVPPFYHLKNADLSPGLGYFTGFVHQWHMRLFFLLAGWSLFASLARRGKDVFLSERNRRILVPFAAGCLLFAPFMRYAEVLNGVFFTPAGEPSDAFANASINDIRIRVDFALLSPRSQDEAVVPSARSLTSGRPGQVKVLNLQSSFHCGEYQRLSVGLHP